MQDILRALAALGFEQAEGSIEAYVDQGRRKEAKKYYLKHSSLPIVLLEGRRPWFYDCHRNRWIHPDHIHDQLERMIAKSSGISFRGTRSLGRNSLEEFLLGLKGMATRAGISVGSCRNRGSRFDRPSSHHDNRPTLPVRPPRTKPDQALGQYQTSSCGSLTPTSTDASL